MAQVKKQHVRRAILSSAMTLITQHGYSKTTLQRIARLAGITTSNVYRYYDSKLELMLEIYDPWLTAQIDRLESRITKIDDPQDRLREIVRTMLHRIPVLDNNFSLNLIGALATTEHRHRYKDQLLASTEQRVSLMLQSCLPPERRGLAEGNLLSRLLLMASDGFSAREKFNVSEPRVEAIVELLAKLLFAGSVASAKSINFNDQHKDRVRATRH